jgi:hypothetical protein
MTALEEAFRVLETARGQDDAPALAQALIDHASTVAELGYFAEAHEAMVEAADIHRGLNNVIDECICLQFAAVVSRLAGDTATAYDHAAYTVGHLPENHPLIVSGYREMAEARFAAGSALAAVQDFTTAIEFARHLSVSRIELAKLLDRRARAFMLAGLHHDALADLKIAEQVLIAEGQTVPATKLAVDQATLLQVMGLADESASQADAAWAMAQANDDSYALSDISLLRSSLALERQDLTGALEAALAAREYALQAVAGQLYVAAALAVAELYDLLDDRHRAYEALAVGYVTLADLVGTALSDDAFLPKLLEKREKWGAETFDTIKADYERYRRKKKGR